VLWSIFTLVAPVTLVLYLFPSRMSPAPRMFSYYFLQPVIEHVISMRDMRNVYKILVRKPESERAFGRLRRRWEGNIIVDLKDGAVRI
jgi:hypothetical protein